MKSSIVENVRRPGGSILELLRVPKSAIKRNNKQQICFSIFPICFICSYIPYFPGLGSLYPLTPISLSWHLPQRGDLKAALERVHVTVKVQHVNSLEDEAIDPSLG